MIVKLRRKDNRYADLTVGQPYVVIGIEGDDYRVLNDTGRPYLYPPSIFRVSDRSEPGDWVVETGDEGERYAYPKALNAPGFFEDYFEGRPRAVRTFWRVVNQRLATASQVA